MKDKNYCELIYEDNVIFIHTYFNACIGQAKYFYRKKHMYGRYVIKEYVNGLIYLSVINEFILKDLTSNVKSSSSL